MFKIFFFIIVAMAGIFINWWVYAILAFSYNVKFPGYSLLLFSLGIDLYYGVNNLVPLYTLITAGVTLSASFVRPYISVE